MHTSTKVLKELMDAKYFAFFLTLEEKGGYWTFDEDCDTFHYGGKALIHLYAMPGDEPDFECHNDFEEMMFEGK